MGNLIKAIKSGELTVPTADATDLLKNITNNQIEALVQNGEILLSDGKGNAFFIQVPADLKTSCEIRNDQISITKIPYSAPQPDTPIKI